MKNTEYLKSLLNALPPNLEAIEEEVKNNSYSSKDITIAVCEFCDNCKRDYTDFIDEHNKKPPIEELHSTYIYPICEVLLKYGLDPNLIFGDKYDENNLMFQLWYVSNPYVGADTFRLLLANGADPMLVFDDYPIFNLVENGLYFDVTEGYYSEEYYAVKFDCRFHIWLVFLAFVAEDGSKEKKYINHEKYTYVISKKSEYKWVIGAIEK